VNLQDEIKKAKELLSQLEDKQAVELAKPKSKRILVEGVGCCFLSSDGSVFSSQYSTGLIENDNAFIDKESVQLQAQRNTLVYRMRVAAAECPVDWSEGGSKFYPNWDYSRTRWGFAGMDTFRYSQLPHFACKEKLREFMKSLSPKQQKLLICGVE
jgi:hypothetical protein